MLIIFVNLNLCFNDNGSLECSIEYMQLMEFIADDIFLEKRYWQCKKGITTQCLTRALHYSIGFSNLLELACCCILTPFTPFTSINVCFLSDDVGERSGSGVVSLTRDREAAGSSLTSVTALCP